MMPNFTPTALVPSQHSVNVRQFATPPHGPGPQHDAVQATLDRYDYAGLPQASEVELGRVASLPNGGPQIAQGLRGAAAAGDTNALRSWFPPLCDLLQQLGHPPQLAAAYATMGIRAAAVQGAFAGLASMEAHYGAREGSLVAAEQASTAAWECASLANIAPFVENSPMFATVRTARQPRYQSVALPQPAALPVFNRATGYADASTQTDKPKSTFLNGQALDALTPISLDTGTIAGPSSANSASPMTYVWPEQMAGPEQYLLDPLSPEFSAVPLQAAISNRPSSPLLFDDVFSFFPVTHPSSPHVTLAPTRPATPDSMQDAPFSPDPSAGRSLSPQPALQRSLDASRNAPPDASTPVAKRTRRRGRKQLIVKLVLSGQRAKLQDIVGVRNAPQERKSATTLPRNFACAGGCGDAHCGKSFARQEHVKRHQKIVRDIACLFTGCEKMFSRPDNMKQHLRTHRPTVGLEQPAA